MGQVPFNEDYNLGYRGSGVDPGAGTQDTLISYSRPNVPFLDCGRNQSLQREHRTFLATVPVSLAGVYEPISSLVTFKNILMVLKSF